MVTTNNRHDETVQVNWLVSTNQSFAPPMHLKNKINWHTLVHLLLPFHFIINYMTFNYMNTKLIIFDIYMSVS